MPLLDCEMSSSKVYRVIKQVSDISCSTKNSKAQKNIFSNEFQSSSGRGTSTKKTKSEYKIEKTCSFDKGILLEKKSECSFTKQQKNYSRSEYETTPDFHPNLDFYQHSPPKTYKNRLSDPGVIQLNNAACLGPSAAIGIATSGSSCIDSGSQPRRHQGPLLLKGNASHSIGPVPFATSSGTSLIVIFILLLLLLSSSNVIDYMFLMCKQKKKKSIT